MHDDKKSKKKGKGKKAKDEQNNEPEDEKTKAKKERLRKITEGKKACNKPEHMCAGAIRVGVANNIPDRF